MALTRSSSAPAGLAQRVRIVLLAADGVSNTEIASRMAISRPTVIAGRALDDASGGLRDRALSGRPRAFDHSQIISTTLKPPPPKLGVTHWSSRLLAKHLGISFAAVARPARRGWRGPEREAEAAQIDPRKRQQILN